MKYVEIAYAFLKGLLPVTEHIHIRIDTPSSSFLPPSVIDGYRPDLYYNHNGLLIIGEAKTDPDFDKRHSIEQYNSYYSECKLHGENSVIVVSCSLIISPGFANLMRYIKLLKGYKAKVIVVNQLGKYKEF